MGPGRQTSRHESGVNANLVIPGRGPLPANPESIFTVRDYAIPDRLAALGVRNDN